MKIIENAVTMPIVRVATNEDIEELISSIWITVTRTMPNMNTSGLYGDDSVSRNFFKKLLKENIEKKIDKGYSVIFGEITRANNIGNNFTQEVILEDETKSEQIKIGKCHATNNMFGSLIFFYTDNDGNIPKSIESFKRAFR